MRRTFLLLVPLLLGLAAPAPPAVPAGVCPPEYYQIPLAPTGRVPGTGAAEGVGAVSFADSPFGIAVSPDGSYVYDLQITTTGLPPPRAGAYVAWIATPDLQQHERLGVLGADGRIAGRVAWNKFLVIISLEASAELPERWQGPIILRGLSRSGLMHTMAGHGPFQQEPCAMYGYY